MTAPKVAVLFGFGINCDHETAAVFNLVGGAAERVHVNHFISGERSMEEFQILAVPGGFSFGDHLGSGRLMGNRMRFALRDQLHAFVAAGKPIIGICNGFQVLVKTGLLPGPNAPLPDFVQRASLTLNDSGRYEDRWVTLEFDDNSPCIWTKGMTRMDCPVRHGEGKFVMPSTTDFDALAAGHQLTVRYVDPATEVGSGMTDEPLPFPLSPNGSMRNIAGVCDATGLVFGLMPHPEAVYAKWLHPDHTRNTAPGPEHSEALGAWEGEGLQMFRNAVEYVKTNL
ncbi:MAG: phosphoribosylformylglycinamidine synthase subunit PurQ [Euryarchaeota archaeon]|jgi:phosphoribosylformylglycinamidine synthase I|tara:strand:- start:901 stop:1749 length:849 start_codon:yes stop_codon:yes gene_type:complete